MKDIDEKIIDVLNSARTLQMSLESFSCMGSQLGTYYLKPYEIMADDIANKLADIHRGLKNEEDYKKD